MIEITANKANPHPAAIIDDRCKIQKSPITIGLFVRIGNDLIGANRSVQALLNPQPLLGGIKQLVKLMLDGHLVNGKLQAGFVTFGNIAVRLTLVELRRGQNPQQAVAPAAFGTAVVLNQAFRRLLVFAAQGTQLVVLFAGQIELADVAVGVEILDVQRESGGREAAQKTGNGSGTERSA